MLLRFSRTGHRFSVVRFPVGPTRAPASIPTQHGLATRFTAPSASGRAGSRTGLPHCTPLRHGEVDEARDWPRLPESVGPPWDRRTPEPLLLRRPPPSFRSSPSAGVDQAGPGPFPADDGGKYMAPSKPRKCRICFGLDHFDVRGMWTPNCPPQSTSIRMSPECRFVDMETLWARLLYP